MARVIIVEIDSGDPVINPATGEPLAFDVPPVDRIVVAEGQAVVFVDVAFGDPADPDVTISTEGETVVISHENGWSLVLENLYQLFETGALAEIRFTDAEDATGFGIVSSLDDLLATAAGGNGGGTILPGGTGSDGNIDNATGDLGGEGAGEGGDTGGDGGGAGEGGDDSGGDGGGGGGDGGGGPDAPLFVFDAIDDEGAGATALTDSGLDAGNDSVLADFTATEGQTLSIATDVLLANDTTDGGTGTLTVSAVSNPFGGSVSLDGGTVTFTPTADFSGLGGFTYTVSEPGTGLSDTATVTVWVNPVFDGSLAETIAAPAGNEDTAIPLNLDLALTPPETGEVIDSVVISGMPADAVLSAGFDQGDGSWTLLPSELTGLTLTPPANSDAPIALTVSVTASDRVIDPLTGDALTLDSLIADGALPGQPVGGLDADTETLTRSFTVTVDGIADTPTLTVGDVGTTEDTQVTLDLSAALQDLDGSETLSVTISGVPNGASLSTGTALGGGVFALTAAEVAAGVSFTPVADCDQDVTLEVTATATEAGGDTTSVTDSMTVSVAAVADAPTLTVGDVGTTEDTAVTLDLSAALQDLDGSETLSVTISGVPDGASLSTGTALGGGVFTLTAAEVAGGVSFTPVPDCDQDVTLEVTATATEAGGDTISVTDSMTVSVAAVADTPTLTVGNVGTTEDTAVTLDLSAALQDLDGSETLSVTVSGVPEGASLSTGTAQGAGVFILTATEVAGGVSFTPVPDCDQDVTLEVTATATEAGGDTTSVTDNLTVSVAAVADTPTLTVGDVGTTEDTPVTLDLSAALQDLDGSETLSVTISGVPDGASLNTGTALGGGVFTLTAAEVAGGVSFTPVPDCDQDVTLEVTATATEAGGDSVSVTDSMTISIVASDGVAEPPLLTVNDVSTNEDTAVTLDLSAALQDLDGSETLSVTISGVPDGASLSTGTAQGAGVFTLTAAEVAAGVSFTPVADCDQDVTLEVTATATEAGGDTTSVTDNLTVSVAAIADTPTLTVGDVGTTEDTPVALDLSAALQDLDGSETLSVTISGVPDGASLNTGTALGGGVFTLTAAEVAGGVSFTPVADCDQDVTLEVTATATEAGGDTNSVTDSMTVSIAAVADAPSLTVGDVGTTEDTAVTLDLSAALQDLDGSETLSVTISGVPDGASLNTGTALGGGVFTLTAAEVAGGVSFTPVSDCDQDVTLEVTATATEAGGDTISVTDNLTVSVAAVADTPTLTVGDVGTTEDTAVALDLSAALQDLDGSETLSVTISGVPDGASLNTGTALGGGVFTLTAAEVAGGVNFTPVPDCDQDVTLEVTATATEAGGDTISVTDSMTVTVAAVADAPTLTVGDVGTTEDTPVTLDLSAALQDLDGSETLSVTISGVPDGASLNTGTALGGGVFTLTAAEVAGGVSFTPVADCDQDVTLEVTATATEAGGDTTSVTDSMTVSVAAVADTPTLTVGDIGTTEDTPVTLDLSAALQDLDGSETLSVTISGVPDGASLNTGTAQGAGVFTLTAAEVAGGVSFTPVPDCDQDVTLEVTATATEAGGDTNSVTDSMTISIVASDGVAEPPLLTVNDVSTNEDTAVTLDLSATLQDLDGSETLSVTISGVPDGASLSTGTAQGAGVFTLTAAEVAAGVSFTPVADCDQDVTLEVTATATEIGAGSASVSDSLTVTVDPVADTPLLATNDAAGHVAFGIPLTITASPADTDGSESLAIQISGVPEDAQLSAGDNQGSGIWLLQQGDLAGLRVFPDTGCDDDFTLSVTATATEAGGGSAQASAEIRVETDISNLPPSAADDLITLSDPRADEAVIAPNILLFNDNDDNGDALSIVQVNGDSLTGATAALVGGAVVLSNIGDAEMAGAFEYVISDGQDTAQAAVTLGPGGIVIETRPDSSGDGSRGDDTIAGGGDGADTLRGGSGDDVVFGGGGDDTLRGDVGSDTLVSGDGDDSIHAGQGDDFIEGQAGDDTIQGTTGQDTLFGNDGDDLLFGGQGNDLLFGGAGNDSLLGDTGDDTLFGGAGDDSLKGNNGADSLMGEAGDDTLNGGVNDDTLRGGLGNDRLVGDRGDDRLFGDSGNDFLIGGRGTDTLFGGSGDDTLSAGDQDDLLVGELGDDSLTGGRGGDTLRGGSGNDRLNGGRDDDLFVFDGQGLDTVEDFSGGDILDFSDVLTIADGEDLLDFLNFEGDGSGNTRILTDPTGTGSFDLTGILQGTGLDNDDVTSLLDSGQIIVD